MSLGDILEWAGLYEPAYRVRSRLHPRHRRGRAKRASFYRQFVSPADLVFDVGANMGNRTDAFLDCGARVLAIEPQHRCARSLRRLYRRTPDVTVLQVALGNEPGEAVLRLAETHTIASMSEDFITATQASGRFSKFHWHGTETVPVTTLDRLLEEQGSPAFCKIDVEGYEPQVLAGLSQPISGLSFEFTSELLHMAAECVRRLDQLGRYEYRVSLGESMAWATEEWLDADTVLAALYGMPRGEWATSTRASAARSHRVVTSHVAPRTSRPSSNTRERDGWSSRARTEGCATSSADAVRATLRLA